MNKKIQILVVTGQPLPNLIPILSFRPKKIVCLVSKQMSDKAILFKKSLTHSGYDSDDTLVIEFDSGKSLQKDIDYLINVFSDLEEKFDHHSFELNLTGGTKLMTLACYEAFKYLENEENCAFYVDSDNDLIQYIMPKGKSPIPITSILDIPIILTANELSLRSYIDENHCDFESIRNRFNKVSSYIIKNLEQLDYFFSVINTQLNEDNLSALMTFKNKPRPVIKRLLEKLEELSLINMQDELNFRAFSKKAATYLKGGWLEEFVFITAVDSGFDHVYMNVEVLAGNTKDDVRNEMDVCIVNHNQMTFIECKSGWINKSNKDADTVYKLDSLAEKAGGIMVRKVLVSARELDHKNKQKRMIKTSKRAKSHEIITIEKTQIQELAKVFQSWK